MLKSIFESGQTLSLESFIIASLSAIIFGLVIAFVHKKTADSNKNFVETLVIIPILVGTIVLMVNGSLGTSIAIAGTFSLVKFRSMPGTSREILSILFAMTIGLAIGMGQIMLALILTALVSVVLIVISKINFGYNNKILLITIPENLDYEDIFKETFDKYLNSYSLKKSKTSNMGSLFELTYNVNLKKNIKEKNFIDELREKNGNLKISLSHELSGGEL